MGGGGGGVQNTMGFQFTIQGGSVFNKGVQYTMDVNRPWVQYTMGFKIPYDTGIDGVLLYNILYVLFNSREFHKMSNPIIRWEIQNSIV